MTKTNGGRLLKRGDTRDPEDHRMTYRLGLGQRLLRGWGVEQTWTHSDNRSWLDGSKHACDYRCRGMWPEWVTDDVFDTAYAFANAFQTARGDYNQREAYRKFNEREALG